MKTSVVLLLKLSILVTLFNCNLHVFGQEQMGKAQSRRSEQTAQQSGKGNGKKLQKNDLINSIKSSIEAAVKPADKTLEGATKNSVADLVKANDEYANAVRKIYAELTPETKYRDREYRILISAQNAAKGRQTKGLIIPIRWQ